MDSTRPDLLDQLVTGVTANPKYLPISPDLVRWIGARELGQQRNLKEAIKATRNKLHQVAGSYQDHKIHYAHCLAELAEAVEFAGQPDPLLSPKTISPVLRAALSSIMRRHASTLERLPILDEFYKQILGPIGPIQSVLDLACGLNPLAAAWMPLAPGAQYHAIDIYQDMIDFLNQVFVGAPFIGALEGGTHKGCPNGGIRGYAERANLLQGVPDQHYQVALLLKTLPCLEQVDKSISPRLLDAIQADHVVVSYPVTSLGGKSKGMRSFYEAHFKNLVAGRPWKIEKFDFSTELVFMVTR